MLVNILDDPTQKQDLLMNQAALQEYILILCQHGSGGLYDKPGKPRDVYHTCYGLSGLSVAQTPKCDNPTEPFLITPSQGNGSLSSNTVVSKQVTHPPSVIYNHCF